MSMQPAETLIHGPVRLRRWRTSDTENLYGLVGESLEHLLPWMPWAAGHSREQTSGFLGRCQQDWATGDAYEYAITADGSMVGSCGLIRRIGPGGLEIGYWLSPTQTGRGLVTSSAAALTTQAFGLPGIERVEIHHDEANTASEAVPGRLGFTRVETRPASPPFAPAGSGTNIVWRMGRTVFGNREWGAVS